MPHHVLLMNCLNSHVEIVDVVVIKLNAVCVFYVRTLNKRAARLNFQHTP